MTDPRDRQDLIESAALYAAGAMGDEDRRRFEQLVEQASAADRQEAASFQSVAQELAFAGPMAAPPASLKERLMARIALEPQERPGVSDFIVVHSEGLSWQEVGGGASMKLLFNDTAGARMTMLIRLAPGGTIAAHRHAQVE